MSQEPGWQKGFGRGKKLVRKKPLTHLSSKKITPYAQLYARRRKPGLGRTNEPNRKDEKVWGSEAHAKSYTSPLCDQIWSALLLKSRAAALYH